MKAGYTVFFACLFFCGCHQGAIARSEVISHGDQEWADFRRGDLRKLLSNFSGNESESEAAVVLGAPDKIEISGSMRSVYWVAASRRGGSPREGVEPTFQVSYLIVKMNFFSGGSDCEIRLVEYIGSDPAPDPFLVMPVVSEVKPCSYYHETNVENRDARKIRS